MRLEIELLGRFLVRVDGRPVPHDAWRHRRAAELVKLLALAPEHRLTAEQVIDTLWPALSPAAGAANLRKAAHLARRALGAADLVLMRGGAVVLAAAADVRTDVEAFEAAAAAALIAGDPEAARSACRLYRGELLPDDRYEPWAEEPRERLRRRYLDLLRKAQLWQRVVDLEPLDEEANRALMSAFAAAGNRHAALRQFGRLRDRLAGELGLRPSEETVALYEEIRRGPAAVAPVAAESPLVGREAELDRALAAWEAASRGRGGALLVTGEPGIGKTRFCEELLTRAAASGWTTLRGAARIEEGRAPFAPIAEALDRLLLLRPDLAARLTAAAQREVARLTPALASTGADDPASSRERLFAAVAQLLAAAARERRVVILVDDVHAADEATLQLLHYVVRRARFQPLLVVVSYRSPGEHVAQTAASLLEQRLATRIDLGPLTRQDSFELIERTARIRPPAEAAAAIWELAAGNPFYTEELAAHVGADGSLRVPSQLHEIVLARVEALGRDARHGLARTAVLGAEFTADEFVAVSGLAEELAFDSLDVALAAGVVEEREAGYRFRHVLTRDALEESLPAHRRRVAHRKAAEWLAEGRAQPVRVAHHLLRAGDEREAVPWLEEAARRALALGALADASRLAEDALAFADEAHRPAILELRGDIHYGLGAPEAAMAYGDALAQVRGGTRRRLRVKQARAYLDAGDVDAASEALAGVEASTADERLALLLARGYLAWARNEVDEAERAAADARTLALDQRSVAELLQATQLLGLAALSRGAWRDFVRAEVASTAGQAAELVDAIFDAHLCLAEFLLHGEEPYEAIAQFAGGLRSLAAGMRSPRAEAFAVCMLGEAELHAGRLEEAGGHLSAAVELHRRAGAATGEALSLQRLADSSLARGDGARAAAFLREALASAQTSAWRAHLLPRVYATMLQMKLERPNALALLDEAELELEQSTPCQACAIGFFTAAAAVTARGGDLERSRRYLEQAESVAAMWEGGMWAAAVREAGAVLRLAAGEATRARSLFAEAARIFEGAGQPRDADRCRAAATRLRPVSVSR